MRSHVGVGAVALLLASAASLAMAQTAPGTPGETHTDPPVQQSPRVDQAIGPPNAETGESGWPSGDVPHPVPGAGPETMPAKYSDENAAKDERAIMEAPVPLNDEQKRLIWRTVAEREDRVRATDAAIVAETGALLPPTVEGEALPDDLREQIPALRGLKYVTHDGKVLLVGSSNRIVRGVIEE